MNSTTILVVVTNLSSGALCGPPHRSGLHGDRRQDRRRRPVVTARRPARSDSPGPQHARNRRPRDVPGNSGEFGDSDHHSLGAQYGTGKSASARRGRGRLRKQAVRYSGTAGSHPGCVAPFANVRRKRTDRVPDGRSGNRFHGAPRDGWGKDIAADAKRIRSAAIAGGESEQSDPSPQAVAERLGTRLRRRSGVSALLRQSIPQEDRAATIEAEVPIDRALGGLSFRIQQNPKPSDWPV